MAKRNVTVELKVIEEFNMSDNKYYSLDDLIDKLIKIRNNNKKPNIELVVNPWYSESSQVFISIEELPIIVDNPDLVDVLDCPQNF